MKTLNDCLNEGNVPDIEGLVSLISSRCRQKTRDALARRLANMPSFIARCGIFERLTCDNGGWEYTCGQSWPDEMRVLRECILGK